MSGQLTFEGQQPAAGVPAVAARFSAAQRAILRHLAEHGEIRSIDAGRIVHLHRTPRCYRCENGHPPCPWASSDGGEALKRLRDRGLVQRTARGIWTAVSERGAA